MEFDCSSRGGVLNIAPEGTSRDKKIEISTTNKTANPQKIKADIERYLSGLFCWVRSQSRNLVVLQRYKSQSNGEIFIHMLTEMHLNLFRTLPK